MNHLFRSLWYDRRINLAVILGVMCAAAVLTGALLVGDSMRGSLKALTLDRLGSIDTILFAPDFIDENIETGIKSSNAVTVIYLSGVAAYNGKTSPTQILAMPDTARKPLRLGLVDIPAVNQMLADKLQIKTGDELSLRFLSPQSIPPESTFGKHNNLIRTKISTDRIIDDKGIGRFSLKADQQAEPLIIVPLEFLQAKLDVGKKVNAVFYLNDTLSEVGKFDPTLDDLGINAAQKDDLYYYTSKRMLFSPPQVEIIQRAIHKASGERSAAKLPVSFAALLYLASSIKANGSETPYSTILAINDLELKENEIALNEWAADDLNVKIGDEIELTYFEPDNVNVTKSKTFTLAKIIPNERYPNEVVPQIKGFTDEQSIADWDPPFPFDAKKIRKKDEDYWDKYRAAPKAVISLADGQELFGSRFGNVSVFVAKTEPETLRQILFADTPLSIFNLNFVPVKEQGLAASQGTTPFSVLFLCFSFFIIASALMLVMMLFRLSVEMKAKQIGIRLACGWTHRQILKLHLMQGVILAVIGSFFGVLFGVLYAQLMIYGLTTFWLEAVSVPFLRLYVEPLSLLIGFVGGTFSAVLVIAFTLRITKRIPVKTLLGGDYAA